MKKTKNTSNLPVIISNVVSGIALTVAAGIAIKLRKEAEDLEFKHDILEAEIGDMETEIQDMVDEVDEKLREIDKRKFHTLNMEDLLEKVDIPDDSDIDDILKEVDIPDDSDIDEGEIL